MKWGVFSVFMFLFIFLRIKNLKKKNIIKAYQNRSSSVR